MRAVPVYLGEFEYLVLLAIMRLRRRPTPCPSLVKSNNTPGAR
jgi:hypothetical protein